MKTAIMTLALALTAVGGAFAAETPKEFRRWAGDKVETLREDMDRLDRRLGDYREDTREKYKDRISELKERVSKLEGRLDEAGDRQDKGAWETREDVRDELKDIREDFRDLGRKLERRR